MSIGNIQPYETSGGSNRFGGSIKFFVAAGTTSSILSGEPVQKTPGVGGVAAIANGVTTFPSSANRLAGVAMTASSETATVVGLVDVVTASPDQVWVCNALSAAAVSTQTLYNALVGKRVVFDKTAGVYTVATATVDAAGNGLIIQYLDVSRYPGQVAFTFNSAADYRNL